jgi:hypothetical protein
MWNGPFAASFAANFTYYAAVNTNDIVPMGWANLNNVLKTYAAPGPSLEQTDFKLYLAIDLLNKVIPTYTQIAPSNPDPFTIAPVANASWTSEAGWMHSMQLQYFPHATGTQAPQLPGTTTTGLARPRMAA